MCLIFVMTLLSLRKINDIHYYFAVSYHVLTLDRNILILFEATHKRKKGVYSDITNESQIICGFASV